jgi:hypothetical protein
MLETVSVGVIAGYTALAALARSSTAVSREATELHSFASCLVGNGESSVALFGDKAAALDQLEQLAAECSEQGWDGYDAQPVSGIAKLNAEHFIRMLPDRFPLPEFSAEPDGSISLDWIKSRNSVFTLSIGDNDRVAFAWLDGTDRGHGVVRLVRDQIPDRVLDGIRALFSDNALLRAA